MPHFKLTISYEGTNFVGWQRQASGTSIQELLEKAFSVLDAQPVMVTGAGRTDAGVHALRPHMRPPPGGLIRPGERLPRRPA